MWPFDSRLRAAEQPVVGADYGIADAFEVGAQVFLSGATLRGKVLLSGNGDSRLVVAFAPSVSGYVYRGDLYALSDTIKRYSVPALRLDAPLLIGVRLLGRTELQGGIGISPTWNYPQNDSCSLPYNRETGYEVPIPPRTPECFEYTERLKPFRVVRLTGTVAASIPIGERFGIVGELGFERLLETSWANAYPLVGHQPDNLSSRWRGGLGGVVRF